MKTTLKSLFAICLIPLLWNCKECNDHTPVEKEEAILLEIEPGNTTFIGEDENHFYSNSFLSKNDTTLYRLPVETGTQYILWTVQPTQSFSNIEMVLLNSDLDTLTFSTNENGIPKIFFDSHVTDDVYLSVYLNGNYNETMAYKLYFEKSESLSIEALSYQWTYTGSWQIENSDAISLTMYDSRRFRWLRLDTPLDIKPTVTFTLQSSTMTELPSFGFIGGGSTDLLSWSDFKEELPAYGDFYHILNQTNYRILDINGDGISFRRGSYDSGIIDISAGVEVKLEYSDDSAYEIYSIYVNENYVGYLQTQLLNKFYIVFEELGFNEITIKDLKIE